MSHTITLGPRAGASDGDRSEGLRLSDHLPSTLVVDATTVSGRCHPMFLLRLRIFTDWHLARGRAVSILGPRDQLAARQFMDMQVLRGTRTNPDLSRAQTSGVTDSTTVLPVRRLEDHHAVEECAIHAVDVLHQQVAALAAWGDPVHMAVSELCDNAIQHGRDALLPAYVAADRVDGDHRVFRLAIADVGIGIPAHVRRRHPAWGDDTAAIAKALDRGVTGTRDAHRGNGFAEVFDEALARQLVRSRSTVNVDIRAGSGHVRVQLLHGQQHIAPGNPRRAQPGTWITYTVTTI